MNQSERPCRRPAAVLVVVYLSLFTASYFVFQVPLHRKLTGKSAQVADATARSLAIERPDAEAERRTERSQKMKSRLTSLPAESGGGFIVNDVVNEFRDDDWEDIVRTPGIRAVWSRSLSPAAWESIAAFQDLEAFNFRFSNATDDDLKCLARLSRLEVLVLQTPVSRSEPVTYYGRKPPYSAVALEPLGRMIHLRQVSLASDLLLDDALAQVKAVPNLLVLSLNGHFTNHGLKSLSDLSEIRRLSLSGHFDDAGLIHLAKLVSLETLALRSDRLSGHGLAHLSKLPHLKNLIVRGLRPGWTFAPLKDLPALEVLNLGDDGLTDELLATLPSTDRIRSLSLQGADKVTDEGLKHLLRLPKLEELNLLQTGMSPQGLRTISSLEEIRKLLPDTNPTTSDDLEQGLEYLTRLPKLEELDLRYMGLSGVNVNMLNIPTLRKLNFDSDRHREELSQLLRQIPQLDPVTTQRITTQAELVGDSSFWQYDFLSNRLVVEADDKKGYCKASGAQASRLKTLTERLQPIAQKQGGGYSIDSEYCELTDNDLVDVVKIPWIRTVYDNGFGPAAWSQFGKLTELESLRSENDNLTNDDLNCLENLHNLEVLSLHARVTRSETGTQPVRRASFSAAALEPLQRMSHLRELQLRGDGVSDDVLTFVGRVPHLISLTLDGRITNNGLKSLSGLKSLQRLSLEGDFDDAGLVHLADLKNLESLVLKSDHVTGTGLAHLSSLPKLRLFKLRALKTGDSLAALKDWPALEALNLADEGTTDEILRTLPESDRIKSVSLLCSSVTDQGLASLQRLGGLEELNLQLTHVTDKGLEIVAGCQKLRVLCLGRAIQDHGITEKGLRSLTHLPHLEALDLRSVDLTDVDLQVLAGSSLVRLNVGAQDLEDKLSQLRERLPKLDTSASKPLSILAGLCDESKFGMYDVLSNRMEIEW